MTQIAFLDTETTGLDPDRHEIWELAYILRDPRQDDREFVWHFDVDLSRAEPLSLTINRYYRRTVGITWDDRYVAAREIARDLDGRHIVGAVPSFDANFLSRLLRAHGHCPTWHYHLIDVEPLAVGYLRGKYAETVALPYKSLSLSERIGVSPPRDQDAHAALGDARWARAIYDTVMGS